MVSRYGRPRVARWVLKVGVAGLGSVALALAGCNASPTTTRGDEDNVLLTDALSFDGTLSGKVFETQTTRESTVEEPTAEQTVPPTFDTDTTVVRFNDLLGNPLVGPDGLPIGPVAMDTDGSFAAGNLPVGTDFTLCVDIGNDEDCDQESCVHIPTDDLQNRGSLEDVRVDPLTTVILAKLRRLIDERNIRPQDLPISPVAVVTRIVEAYTHLYEEAGVDHTITRAELENITLAQLGELFDQVIPSAAQAGMQIVEGNLDLARAENVNGKALAVAEIFLRAGFPIADGPNGIDLSPLALLDGVTFATLGQFKETDQKEFDEVFDEHADPLDALDQTQQNAQAIGDVVVYFDTTAEPDRNFGALDEGFEDEGGVGPRLPVIREHVLARMAAASERGRTVTLGQIYEAMTSLENGLGARLTWNVFDPNFFGPPLTVFETGDGNGKAINFDRVFRRLQERGFDELRPEEFGAQEAEFRALLVELLDGTVAPPFGRLFDGFLSDRVASAADFTERIRSARAHIPFNRTGSSTFFVVGSGDPFANADDDNTDLAVTVDAVLDIDGRLQGVTYNPSGDGEFYLGFTERTDGDGIVELIVRETGRRLHGRRGPARASIQNGMIFGEVDGASFAEFVSERGGFYPGVNVPVVRSDGAFSSDAGGPAGAREQLFVLATAPGRDAEPVRIDYDRDTGVATYNPRGRHLLVFMPGTFETGRFGLFNEDTGRMALAGDPAEFFQGPGDRPEGFEDFINEFDEFDDIGDFGDFGDNGEFEDFIDDFLGDEDGTNDELSDDFNTDGIFDDFNTDGIDDDVSTDGFDDIDTGGAAQVVPDASTDGFEDPTEDGGFEGDFHPPVIEPIMVVAEEVRGLQIAVLDFTRVFGVEVPNERYDRAADPFYDDVNNNDIWDAGEPTAAYRPTLFDPRDWRSTDIPLYYRRADNGQAVSFEEVAFDSSDPRTVDGVGLVRRVYKARANAFRFGRPNTAINLLTAFASPSFFNGTQEFNRDTEVNVFTAVAIVNLVFDQVFNVEAQVDPDGTGPLPRVRQLIDAHMFVIPVDDPFVVLVRAIFAQLGIDEAEIDEAVNNGGSRSGGTR